MYQNLKSNDLTTVTGEYSMFKKFGVMLLLISFLSLGNLFAQAEEVDNAPEEEITDTDKKTPAKENSSKKEAKLEKKASKKDKKAAKKKAKKAKKAEAPAEKTTE
ncbi:MAG: hypothetical protein SFU98_00865 [Leptospiraceae bacterium]|nr:hypothetical protein [Leptospiraceae bacterium]